MELETGLSPVEADPDGHRPLMGSEQEAETGDRHFHPPQQPDEPMAESPGAIGFLQAFCLPGVLPVSLQPQHDTPHVKEDVTPPLTNHCWCLFNSIRWRTHV